MSHSRRLSGRKIAVLAADGYEKVELVVPMRALQLAGAKTEVVSLRGGRIRGVNLHMPATRVGVDKVVTDADPDAYDGLLLPGGFINPDLLRQSAPARDLVRAFDHSGKPIATLCHGPCVLASAGLLSGRTLTSWPGIRDDLVNAGATWLDREVVRDRNLVTSRGPRICGPSYRPWSTPSPKNRVHCKRCQTLRARIPRWTSPSDGRWRRCGGRPNRRRQRSSARPPPLLRRRYVHGYRSERRSDGGVGPLDCRSGRPRGLGGRPFQGVAEAADAGLVIGGVGLDGFSPDGFLPSDRTGVSG